MNYQDFVCPECTYHPLQQGDDYLLCPTCCIRYPIRQSVPLLFPSKEPCAVVDGHRISLQAMQDVYDCAYRHDGLMGTDLDETYDRVTKSILLDFAQPLACKRVLDLGTGVGRLWDYAPRDVTAYAIDLSSIGVAKALQRRPDLTVSASVAEHLPYLDSFFDLVVSADTIEHTFSPRQTLAEVWRVLKGGGVFSTSLPVPNSLRKWGWNQFRSGRCQPGFVLRLGWVLLNRVRLFGKATFQPIDRDLSLQGWVGLIESAGFVVRKVIEWPDAPQTPIVYLVHAERL